jgi:hypothetical protein
VRAPADGHTLLLTGPSNAINATIYDKLNYNFIRDIIMFAGTSTPAARSICRRLSVNRRSCGFDLWLSPSGAVRPLAGGPANKTSGRSNTAPTAQ